MGHCAPPGSPSQVAEQQLILRDISQIDRLRRTERDYRRRTFRYVRQMTVDDIEASFKGRGPWKKSLPRILETLKALGRARREEIDGKEGWRARRRGRCRD
jgi:hypothetical protein